MVLLTAVRALRYTLTLLSSNWQMTNVVGLSFEVE